MVEAVTVTQAPPSQPLRLPGGTEGWYQSKIYGRVSGYITKWFADIGDRVKKDQVLAIIDTPELDAQLEASRAQLNAAEAEVVVREADAQFAKTTYDRWQGSAKGVVSEQERDEKKRRLRRRSGEGESRASQGQSRQVECRSPDLHDPIQESVSAV